MSILDLYATDAKKYLNKGILVDTGLLLLLVVGLYDENQTEQIPCMRSHNIEHFDLLISILAEFRKIVTTPNILTEVSDLLGKVSSHKKEEVLLKSFVPCIDRMDEKYTRSSELSKIAYFSILGLADTSIVKSARRNYLVLTEDVALWAHLRKNKVASVNFNHLCYS
jgi:hypothetical protein